MRLAMDLVYRPLLYMIASMEVVLEYLQKKKKKQYILDHTHKKI